MRGICQQLFRFASIASCFFLAACGGGGGGEGGGGGNDGDTTSTFSVAGTVSGLAGSGLVLRNNGTGDIAIGSNGNVTFASAVPSGTGYSLTVITQPSNPAQTCTIANGAGTVGSSDVTNVNISCATNAYAIGVTVSGLSGTGLVLRNNGADDLAISNNGSFTFATAVSSGKTYNVSVFAQPSAPTQACTVSNGTGTVGSANIANIAVTCVTVVVPPSTYTVGGSVTGLAGSGLVLQNNGTENLPINGNGPFSFAGTLTSGSPYDVTVATQPGNPAQHCTVTNGSGTVSGANVNNITVNCVSAFTLGGTVRYLSGAGLVLQNNAGDDLSIDVSGPFTFAGTLTYGTGYNVTILAQPVSPSQTCGVANGEGTTTGDIGDVLITCTTWTRQIGSGTTDIANDVSADPHGNVYAAGYTLGDFDGNSNSGDPNINDLILVKYDGQGNKLWSRQFGEGYGGALANAVATDSAGNAYVAGWTGGSLDGMTINSGFNMFLVKYAADGTRLWVRQYSADEARGVSVGSDGGIYVTGFTQGNLDGNVNSGGMDMFLIKYDANGAILWSRLLGGAMPVSRPSGPYANESGEGIATDFNGNIYVTGTTDGDLDGNTYAGPNSGGGITQDMFVVKYDSNGAKLWTRQLGTTEQDFPYGVATDGNGNVYITGATFGDLDGNSNAGGTDYPIAPDAFITKYDTNGTRLWTRLLGTVTTEMAYDVVASSDGYIYITGTTGGDLDGNTNADPANLGRADVFVAKYDANGNRIWTRQVGNPRGDVASGITMDASGNVYVAGSTSGDLDGANNGGIDLLIMKYAAENLLQ